MSDLERIREIPSREFNEDAITDRWSKPFSRVDRPVTKLFPLQLAVLDALFEQRDTQRGAIGNLPLGSGKTLVSLLAASVVDCDRPLLIIKAPMRDQLARDIKFWHDRVKFTTPEIVTYSELSSQRLRNILWDLQPDFIVCDEAQSLKNNAAACTRRFIEYVTKSNPRVLALSATMISKSIMDMYNMVTITLRDWSPYPSDEPLKAALAAVEDPEVAESAQDRVLHAVYKKVVGMPFSDRFRKTPNVIFSAKSSCDAPIFYTRTKVKRPQLIDDVYLKVEKDWQLPSEDATVSASAVAGGITDATSYALALRTTSWGFYYETVGLTPELRAARKVWSALSRAAISYKKFSGVDTDGLLRKACIDRPETLDKVIVDAYYDLMALDHQRKDLQFFTKWVDDALIQRMIDRANEYVKAGRSVIVWYYSRGVGEKFKELGFPAYGAGEEIDGSNRAVAASIKVHGTGKNLQHDYDANIIMQCPSSGATLDQLIGRTHRTGQKADNVLVEFMEPSFIFGRAFDTAIETGRLIDRVQASQQKTALMTYCNKIPLTKADLDDN